MPLPETFSPWEHLQNVVMQVQNRRVRKEFNDVGGDDWDPDITTSRASLRVACTLRDDDSILQTFIRLWLFDVTLLGASNLHPAIYGIPVTSFQESVKFLPQIRLYFSEDLAQVEDDFEPVEAEISFRLVGQTSTTLTQSEMRAYANKIRTAFAAGSGFTWKKGRLKASYKDQHHGYNMILTIWSEAEAKRVIEQVLDIQGHAPNWDFLTVNEPKQTFPIVPGFQNILGKSRRKPRERPIAYVRFRYAELKLHGLPNDITLVDRTGFRKNPVVQAS
uniref:hypothetical protein n=1 Tax=Trichocoleus desertorum TaxID=1481672 RepID=UPI0025B29F7E|nr:hypothetical protein [Trichocoleus desertorum]